MATKLKFLKEALLRYLSIAENKYSNNELLKKNNITLYKRKLIHEQMEYS